MKKEKKKFFKNNKEKVILLISLIICLIFFIWQKKFFSWDFAVYILNSEYLFSGIYFEWLRPPLASFIMSLFNFLGREATTYIFVILVTGLYFLSLKLFHNKFLREYNHSEIFYLIALNPFIIGFGLGMGTELLSLSLIILFVTFAYSCKSFIFLGLSMLLRYSNVILFPTVFLSKNIKKILIGIGIIILVFLPWFVINYAYTGHALTSLGDYYALNAIEQAKASLDFGKLLSHLLIVVNVLIPFLLLGIFSKIKENNKEKKYKKLNVLLISISALTILTYLFNSLKDPRYLFTLVFPVVYYSFFSINFIIKKLKNKETRKLIKTIFILFFILLSLSTFLILSNPLINLEKSFKPHEDFLNKLDNNCTISSDMWVYFVWHGKNAIPSPYGSRTIDTGKMQIISMLEEGYNIVLFKNSEAYTKNLPYIGKINNSIKEENANYVWLYADKTCHQIEKINQTYIESLKKIGEFSEDFSGCDALFLKLRLRKICQIFKFL